MVVYRVLWYKYVQEAFKFMVEVSRGQRKCLGFSVLIDLGLEFDYVQRLILQIK